MENDYSRDYGQILGSLRERVRSVCSHLPESEFLQLTERMAQLEWKYLNRSLDVTPFLNRNHE